MEPEVTAPVLPQWEGADAPFESKIEALDAMKEDRPTPLAPSPYPEHMIDEKGYFNPDYMEYEKYRIIDSIYAREDFQREPAYLQTPPEESSDGDESAAPTPTPAARNSQELALEHQLFFAAHHAPTEGVFAARAQITGTQVLRAQSRVRLTTTDRPADTPGGLPSGTTLWGRVSFGANRVFIRLLHPTDPTLTLEAYDLQDGLRGLYLENSFKGEAANEVLQDVIQDVNIAGLPQINGIKNVFRRSGQKVKVTVLDGHGLILKSKSNAL